MSYREMNDRLEAVNYANDERTQPAAGVPFIARDIPCPTCGGTRKVSEPWENWDAGMVIAEGVRDVDCPSCDDGTMYDVEVELPWKYAVCPVCDGKGSHVNPSIDAGGLTAEDFDDDPGFREDYLSGAFDQPCNRCQGKRVVPVVDESRATYDELAAYDERLDADAEYRAERLSEIRAGC